MVRAIMDELVVFSWILLSFEAILSHGVTCLSNNYTQVGMLQYKVVTPSAEHLDLLVAIRNRPPIPSSSKQSWYIWVAVFCGLMLLGTISGIHMRLKHNKSRVAFVTSNNRVAVVQPAQGTRQRPSTFIQPSPYTNPGPGNRFYRPTLMPLRPPPYSPAQPPPPPYQMQGLPGSPIPQLLSPPMSNGRQEKDESMALSMIQPMQPAYHMPDAYGPLLNPSYTHSPPTSGAPPCRVQVMETHHM